jgi:hypothetical protein
MGFDGTVAMVSRDHVDVSDAWDSFRGDNVTQDLYRDAGNSFIGDEVSALRLNLSKLFGTKDSRFDHVFPHSGIRLSIRRTLRSIEGDWQDARKEVFFILCQGVKGEPMAMIDPRPGRSQACEAFSLNLEFPEGADNQAFDLTCDVVTVDKVETGWLSKHGGRLRVKGLNLTMNAVDFVQSLIAAFFK